MTLLRLTIRDPRDGHLLARVVDAGGEAFVLDFGDPEIIADTSRRLAHGFTLWHWGRHVNAVPRAGDMLQLLAEYYLHEGYLAAIEEPTWEGRVDAGDSRMAGFSGRVLDAPEALEDLGASEHDDATEIVGLDDLPSLPTQELEVTEESRKNRIVAVPLEPVSIAAVRGPLADEETAIHAVPLGPRGAGAEEETALHRVPVPTLNPDDYDFDEDAPTEMAPRSMRRKEKGS